MPILQAEPNIYPPKLLTPARARAAPGTAWYAVYTRARQEKGLARFLATNQIPFYLPLVMKRLIYRDRRVTSHVPLFTGYVFVNGTREDRTTSLTSNRILRILDVEDPVPFIRDLRQIQQLIESGAPLTVESRIEPGQAVRIRKGPFANLEGTVLQRKGKTRLVVAINFLQQGVSIEVDDCILDPI